MEPTKPEQEQSKTERKQLPETVEGEVRFVLAIREGKGNGGAIGELPSKIKSLLRDMGIEFVYLQHLDIVDP